MKRSWINTVLADSEDFFEARRIELPPFAHWDPQRMDIKVTQQGYEQVIARGLGWSVTDFGLGDFSTEGNVSFTTRMGDHKMLDSGKGRLYSEKFVIQRDGQRTPFHYHRVKTKDLINRGDATLLVHLYSSTEFGELDETNKVITTVDGQSREVLPGEFISLAPGESIVIDASIYHDYVARDGDILITDISLAHDNVNDNYYYDPIGLVQEIEEDETPRRLLVQDYMQRYPKHAKGS